MTPIINYGASEECYSFTNESLPYPNFAILHWFGMKLAPRFTNLQAQLKGSAHETEKIVR